MGSEFNDWCSYEERDLELEIHSGQKVSEDGGVQMERRSCKLVSAKDRWAP